MTDSYFITFEESEENIAMRYADDVPRFQTQLPLALSWSTYSGVADPGFLFTDDPEQSVLYPSGTNRTAIQIQTKDRYSGLTITVLSGAPSVYVQISEYFADLNPAFIAAPYTISGDAGLSDLYLASYTEDTPEFPENYWIPLPGQGSYKIVFPSPVVGNAITVTHSGSSPYRISQILPRKSVQAYDLEVNSIKAYHVSASLIDTISLQVADSIVVGPDLIGAKSIDGSKIIDGTISGVLIRDGTVTGNKVLAGTISGVLLQGSTITGDKIVANTISGSLIAANTITASKIAAGTITFNEIASGTLTADQIADGAVTGRKILDGTISGVLITNDAISASKIQANAITASKIAAGTITSNEIAVSGITAINMAANSITADNISVRTITAEKIVLSGITAELLGAEAVTAAALASGAVISGKIAEDSIYASNIVGGQITGYHVAANTITGDRLNVNQLDAVAANMGNLVVNSGISIGTNGTIWAGSGPVDTPTTGLKIYTTGGISRLTTYNSSTPQIDIGSDGKLKAGMGNVVLDSTGISIGTIDTPQTLSEALRIYGSGGDGNIVGIAFYNGSYSSTNPQITIQADSTNALEIENNAVNGITNFNFPASGLNNAATVNIYNAHLELKRTPIPFEDNITPGAITGYDSDGTVRYYMGHDQLLLNNNTADTFTVDASNGNINTLGRIHASGNLHVGPGDHVFTVNGTSGNVHVGPPPHVFRVNGTSGNTHIEGTVDIAGATELATTLGVKGDVGFGGDYRDLFTVQGTTGNTLILGTLDVQGNVAVGDSGSELFTVQATTGNTAVLGTFEAAGNIGLGTYFDKLTVQATTGNTAIAGTLGVTGKITADTMGYLTVRRTADLAITTAGTTIVWQSVTRQKNITVSSDTITIANAGYYTFSATFATVANLTSLRMTLLRGAVNYVSTLHGAGLSSGGGYMFNFSVGFFATAGSTYRISLTPSSNTTLNFNGEGFAGPTPILNIYQAIGV